MMIEESNLHLLHRSDSNMRALCQDFLKHAVESLDAESCRYVFDLLKGFGDGRIDDSLLISTLDHSFSGHDHLLRCFRSILPPPTTTSNQDDGDDDGNDDDHIVEKVSLKRKEFASTDKQNSPKRPRFSQDFPPSNNNEQDRSNDGHRFRKVSRQRKDFAATNKKQRSSKKHEFTEYVSMQIEQATDLCNKVRMNFKDDDGVYEYFLDALSTCYDNNDDHKAAASEVKRELKFLFKDHPSLQLQLQNIDCYVKREYEKKKWESEKWGRVCDENTHYKPVKRHPCEKLLFKISDDQDTFDVLCLQLESTRKRMEKLVQEVKQERRSAPIVLEDYLWKLNISCIKAMYDLTRADEGYGHDIIKHLQENPIEVGEIVLRRLYQKEKEIRKEGEVMNAIWANARKDCCERLRKHEFASRSSRPSLPLNEGKE